MVDKIVEKITGMKDMVVAIEVAIGQEKEFLQGIMAETGILAVIGLDQGPEPVQIGIE